MTRSSSMQETVRRAAILLVGAALGAGADRLASGLTREDLGVRPVAAPECPLASRMEEAPGDAGSPSCREVWSNEQRCVVELLDAMGTGMQYRGEPCYYYLDQMELVSALATGRYVLGNEVVSRLGESHPQSARATAAWLLGEFHLVSGIERLLDYVDEVWYPPCLQTRILPISETPVFDALVRLGPPVVDPTIKRLASPESQRRHDYETELIIAILGARRARERLQVALDEETDPERRMRLEDAVAHVKRPDTWQALGHP